MKNKEFLKKLAKLTIMTSVPSYIVLHRTDQPKTQSTKNVRYTIPSRQNGQNSHSFFVPAPVQFSNKQLTIRNHVPLPHNTRTGLEQNLIEWAEGTTKDYQLLDYAPTNLATQIAFLRLIGLHQVSLTQFSRHKGSDKCFINKFDSTDLHQSSSPGCITTTQELFDSVVEFNLQQPAYQSRAYWMLYTAQNTYIRSLEHIRPKIKTAFDNALELNQINQLYQTIAESTNDQLIEYVELFLPNEGNLAKNVLLQRLQEAQEVCRTHVADSKSISCKK